jgi:hypothetical protein
MTERIGMKDAEAQQEIERFDAANSRALGAAFNIDWSDALLYHVVLNSARVSVDAWAIPWLTGDAVKQTAVHIATLSTTTPRAGPIVSKMTREALANPPARSFGQQVADDHEIVGERRSADKQREALGAFAATALRAAATHQHRDAPLDAGTEALTLPERRRSFVSLALRRLAATALRKLTAATPPRTQTAPLFSLKKPRSAP